MIYTSTVSTVISVAMTNSQEILGQIKLESQSYPAGILPPGKSIDSLIGHTVKIYLI